MMILLPKYSQRNYPVGMEDTYSDFVLSWTQRGPVYGISDEPTTEDSTRMYVLVNYPFPPPGPPKAVFGHFREYSKDI